ncbi:MAG: hypothetical protein ABW073_01905 [Acidimicrobiia bacterium]
MLVAAALVVNVIAAANPRAGEGRVPFVTIYSGHRDHIDAVLVSGDGQAFAAIAQDPLLARPELVPGRGEFAYRAQRPLWGYLAWGLSGGQASLVGWALAIMTVFAAGLCVGAISLLLMQRGQSPWWSLAVLAAGMESLSQLTPELLALGFVAFALWLPSRRRGWAIACCCAAAMTRETMLVAVGAWALYEFVHASGPFRARVRGAAPFTIPFVVFAAWVVFLRAHVGTWVWDQPHDRATAPLVGVLDAFNPVSGRITIGVGIALALCGLCLWLARRDVLTWIAIAFALFATTFAGQVWTGAGYERTLLPLYVFGGIAALTGLRRHEAARTAAHTVVSTPPVPPPVLTRAG